MFGKAVFVAYLQSQWSFLKTTKACTLTLLRLIWAKKEPFTALFTIFLFPLFKGLLCRKSNSKRKQKKNCKATQHIMFVTFTTVPMVLSFYCWSRKSHFCPLIRLDSPTPKMVICNMASTNKTFFIIENCNFSFSNLPHTRNTGPISLFHALEKKSIFLPTFLTIESEKKITETHNNSRNFSFWSHCFQVTSGTSTTLHEARPGPISKA